MDETIHQEIIIAAAKGSIFQELLLWGEAEWWPKRSLMRFINLSHTIGENALYLAQVKLPYGPHWHMRNELVDEKAGCIRRVFLDGMFKGFEELRIVPQKDCFKVIYTFCVRVRGFLNRLMWKYVFRNRHIKNIAGILVSLKLYLQQ